MYVSFDRISKNGTNIHSPTHTYTHWVSIEKRISLTLIYIDDDDEIVYVVNVR